MTDLNDIAIFVMVAQMESFSHAAAALGMPVSTVSRRVSRLEERLQTALIHRTTRKLSLTTQGRAYFTECSGPLGHLHEAERVLVETQRKPEGLLKITVPVVLGHEAFYEFVSSFLFRYEDIQIDLAVTNAFLDLVAENVDVAIRFGEMIDSTIVSQRIGTNVRYLVASPDYLRGRTIPMRPEDLSQHRCIVLNGRNNEAEWHLVRGKKEVKVQVRGPVSGRDLQTLSAFTYKGHGIGFLPTNYCEEHIRRGSLVRLLSDWASPEIAVQAVYPSRRFLPAKTQMFLAALKAWKNPLWLPLR
ncbi:LysR family transcriptional regulator [Neorhizobium sp. Rsf11]|uniref:LysR family transcriptional regulator n=2 Tax=Neorhizobium TaxID=1525371 RepID=A0ABV0MBW7_9HYPH|nr:LysR family transcriptional regulator [Neorhizobium petrolearium]MCC2613741.1 LysR family transcriptional regulator [Neorhizobium petrolearium]WGI72053.1 LysR family transcriptional regulator [Neorhizobium petrolearium]